MSILCDDASVAVDRLDMCLLDAKAWLKANCLRLNLTQDTSQLGSEQQLVMVDTDEVSLLASQVHAVRNLGVLFDSQLSMSARFSRASYWLLPAPAAAYACSMPVR